jgi:hypothetical protein
VADDHRQGVFVLRADVDEVNVEPVDLGDEVRHGVDLGFALSPVVLVRPVQRELPDRGEFDALRCVVDLLFVRPLGRDDAPAKVDQIGLARPEAERPDPCAARRAAASGGIVSEAECFRRHRCGEAERAGGCRRGEKASTRRREF